MEETQVISSLEHFAVSISAEQDPFNTMSVLTQDCVSVVEFSELEGPKPLLTVPAVPGAHFDQTSFALSLMTADYQNLNRLRTGALPWFTLADDIQVAVQNDEMGVESFAHYFLLYDVKARGFVRPFCLAYSTKKTGKIMRLFTALRRDIGALLLPLKQCNRRRFLAELSEAIDSLNSVENQTVSSYYGLYYDNNMNKSSVADKSNSSSGGEERPRPSCSRNLRLYGELQHAHKIVRMSLRNGVSPSTCISTHSDVDVTEWLVTVARGAGVCHADAATACMSPLEQLASCAHERFLTALTDLWQSHRQFSMIADYFDCRQDVAGAQLLIDGMPLLTLENTTTDERIPLSFLAESEQEDEGTEKQLLVRALPSLGQLLFPLFTGRCLLIAADDNRRQTVTSLVDRLRRFLPHSRRSPSNDSITSWRTGKLQPLHFAELKLIGLRVSGETTVADCLPPDGHFASVVSVLDLNDGVFRSVRARARILERLAKKRARWFGDSDAQLSAYIFGLLAEYAAFAFVVYHVLYSDRETYRRNSGHMHRFAQRFRLETGDMRIVSYFVEVLMQSCTDSVRFDGSLERFYSESAEPTNISLKL